MESSLLAAALEQARSGRQALLDDLVEELRIPSISTLPESAPDVLRNARWVMAKLEALGFDAALVDVDVEGGQYPVLRAEGPKVAGAPTVTIYGHYDVQPPDPLDLWVHPPFQPHLDGDRLTARGAADNKGNHMAAIGAVEALVRAGGLPLNVRFLIEGEEEISGPSLPRYIAENAASLHSDISLIWDMGFAADDSPALVTGLRGLLYTEVEAVGASHDLHSGSYGGAAPNPINTLARVVGELKGRDGRVTIPGFYDRVREIDPAERARLAAIPDLEATLLRSTGSRALEGEAEHDLPARLGYRPTLDVNGIIGGFTGEGMKTVIPSRATAKVSMRLVADQDADEIFESYSAYVESLTTPGVELRARKLASAAPVVLPFDNPASQAAVRAYEEAYGRPAVFIREGGSVPVTIAFQEHIGGQVLCAGVVQPDCRPHSPNEWLSIDHFHRGVEMLVRFLTGMAHGA